MGNENTPTILPPEWQNRFRKMSEIIEDLHRENSELKIGGKSDENTPLIYLKMFQQFLLDAQANNWMVERKYETKNTVNSVDIDFEKYTDYIKGNLNVREQGKFKEFLLDLKLINPDTFNSKYGKIVTGSGKEKKRIFRVPKEVFFHFTQGSADIAS